MATELVILGDDMRVEAEATEKQAVAIAGGEKITASLERFRPLLLAVCQPLRDTWADLNKDMTLEQAEVELGFGFEGEGNLYLVKSKGSANIKVKLTFKPPPVAVGPASK